MNTDGRMIPSESALTTIKFWDSFPFYHHHSPWWTIVIVDQYRDRAIRQPSLSLQQPQWNRSQFHDTSYHTQKSQRSGSGNKHHNPRPPSTVPQPDPIDHPAAPPKLPGDGAAGWKWWLNWVEIAGCNGEQVGGQTTTTGKNQLPLDVMPSLLYCMKPLLGILPWLLLFDGYWLLEMFRISTARPFLRIVTNKHQTQPVRGWWRGRLHPRDMWRGFMWLHALRIAKLLMVGCPPAAMVNSHVFRWSSLNRVAGKL